MNPPNFICARCGGAMEVGVTIDYSYGEKRQSRWVEGAPETSIWTGLKTRDKEQYKVVTYRCAGCGYLESYALEKTEASILD